AIIEEPDILHNIIKKGLEILHYFEDENGCEKACYDCLCSFYNQYDHKKLDRNCIIPFIEQIYKNREDIKFKVVCKKNIQERLEILDSLCESKDEKDVLILIHSNHLPIPGEAQKTIYDGDVPIVKPDFFYQKGTKGICVFVDGPDHEKDYVMKDDKEKRDWLKQHGYRIVVFDYKDKPEYKEAIRKLRSML
ncbi:MAG: hypothetical protein ACXQTE_06035, partial [Methanosarcinaceae archaeon]